MSLFDVRHRLATVLDTFEQIAHVAANSGGHVDFQVFFRRVFRVLVPLVHPLAADFFAIVSGELVPHYVGLQRPLFAIQYRAPLVIGIRRCAPRAMLPIDLQFVVGKRGRLRVRDVGSALLVHPDPARRRDRLRPPQIEQPAHHVEHVNAHIPHDSVAVLHERTPATRMRHTIETSQRCGTSPHFPVQIVGRSHIGRRVAGPHVVIAEDLHQPDLSELPGLHNSFPRFDQMRRAAALRADLHHPLMTPRGGHHRLPLHHIDTDRLLHIDIRPRLDGGDHRQRVPMVGRRHQYDVQIFFGQQLPIVSKGAGLFLGGLPRGDDFGRAGQHLLVDITQRHHFDRCHLDQSQQITLAIPTAADQSDSFGRLVPASSGNLRARGGPRQAASSELKKRPAIHGARFLSNRVSRWC